MSLPDLSELIFRKFQPNPNCNPLQPGERQKAVYSTCDATREVYKRLLQRNADMIYSLRQLDVQACLQFAKLNGFHEALSRAILIQNVCVGFFSCVL